MSLDYLTFMGGGQRNGSHGGYNSRPNSNSVATMSEAGNIRLISHHCEDFRLRSDSSHVSCRSPSLQEDPLPGPGTRCDARTLLTLAKIWWKHLEVTTNMMQGGGCPIQDFQFFRMPLSKISTNLIIYFHYTIPRFWSSWRTESGVFTKEAWQTTPHCGA